MALRISFESDVKGFERVQKALEAQQELLNANAEAVERLNNAQQGLSKTSIDTKSSESIRASAAHIKDLTGSLETLNKTQAGLKGFMASFSEFGKQIAQIKSESSGQIFKSMSDQMDTLKTNMRAAGFEMDNLRVKMNAAKASGNIDEEHALKGRMNQLRAETLSNNAMLNDLDKTMFWQKPRVGNISYADMRNTALPIMAGVAASSQIAKYGQSFLEKDAREDNMLYARELGIGQAAAGGSIGRQALLNRGLGREAAFLADPSIFDKVKLGLGWAGNFGTKSFNELYMEEAQRKSQLDAKATYGMDRAGQFLTEMSGNQGFSSAERVYGQRAVQQFMLSATSSPDRLNRLTADQSINAMSMAMKYGYGDQYSAAVASRTGRPTRGAVQEMQADILDEGNLAPTAPTYSRYSIDADNRRNYNKAQKRYEQDQARYHATKERAESLRSEASKNRENNYWTNSANFEKGAESAGMSDAYYEQFHRQIGLKTARGMTYEQAMEGTGLDAGRFRQSMGKSVYDNPEAMKMAQSYIANLQANNTTGPAGSGDVGHVMSTVMQGAAAAGGAWNQTTGAEKVQAGISVQQSFSQGFKAFSYQEQLYQGAMSRLGIPNGMIRVQILELLQNNLTEKAVEYMTGILKVDNPKADPDELENKVRKEFGIAQKNLISAQKRAFGVNDRYAGAAKQVGLGSGESLAATGANNIATSEAYGQLENIFEKPKANPITGEISAPKTTTRQDLDAGKAGVDKSVLEVMRRIEIAVGSGAVKKEITDGLASIANAILSSLDSSGLKGSTVTGDRNGQ